MVVLGGVAVSYERGTPVHQVWQLEALEGFPGDQPRTVTPLSLLTPLVRDYQGLIVAGFSRNSDLVLSLRFRDFGFRVQGSGLRVQGSEVIDLMYHSTLGLRVIEQKGRRLRGPCVRRFGGCRSRSSDERLRVEVEVVRLHTEM